MPMVSWLFEATVMTMATAMGKWRDFYPLRKPQLSHCRGTWTARRSGIVEKWEIPMPAVQQPLMEATVGGKSAERRGNPTALQRNDNDDQFSSNKFWDRRCAFFCHA